MVTHTPTEKKLCLSPSAMSPPSPTQQKLLAQGSCCSIPQAPGRVHAYNLCDQRVEPFPPLWSWLSSHWNPPCTPEFLRALDFTSFSDHLWASDFVRDEMTLVQSPTRPYVLAWQPSLRGFSSRPLYRGQLGGAGWDPVRRRLVGLRVANCWGDGTESSHDVRLLKFHHAHLSLHPLDKPCFSLREQLSSPNKEQQPQERNDQMEHPKPHQVSPPLQEPTNNIPNSVNCNSKGS